MSTHSSSDIKPPCMPRNGLVKIPAQSNGLGSASITKGTPAAKNRLCQSSSIPTSLPPPLTNYSDLATVAQVPSASLCAVTDTIPLLEPNSDENLPSTCQPSGSKRKLSISSMEGQLPILDEKILNRLFWYFSSCERCVLAQVCKVWRKLLYQVKFWEGITPILHAKELYNILLNGEKEFVNLQGFAIRGFDSFCLIGVSDLDICEFIDNYPLSKKGVRSVSLKRSTITDAGLEDKIVQIIV